MRQVHTNHSLLAHNTFHIESSAGYFSEPSSIDELKYLMEYAHQRELEQLVIGEGSNMLFRNNFEGLVIHPLMSGIHKTDESDSEILVRVGTAENWDNFVSFCVDHSWYGPENLSLIPGSVGSAPVQNIGAYGVEAKDLIEYVEAYDKQSGELVSFSNQACEFAYRNSIFKHGQINRYIISHVVFRLSKKSELNLEYGNVKEYFEKQAEQNLSTLRDTIIKIREQKLPNPDEYGNAGSFFKNPVIQRSLFEDLLKRNSTIPHYSSGSNHVKIPAAWLIDQCGWKGSREGDVGCWPNQPLVIVNYGQASGDDIYRFSEKIKKSVKEKFGIELEREVKVIG